MQNIESQVVQSWIMNAECPSYKLVQNGKSTFRTILETIDNPKPNNPKLKFTKKKISKIHFGKLENFKNQAF